MRKLELIQLNHCYLFEGMKLKKFDFFEVGSDELYEFETGQDFDGEATFEELSALFLRNKKRQYTWIAKDHSNYSTLTLEIDETCNLFRR